MNNRLLIKTWPGLSIMAACFIMSVVTLAIWWLHGPRTCSDATGYIMGAVSLRLHGSYLWFATDDELKAEGFQCEFSCPKNARDLEEYKRDKTQGYQSHWAPGYPAAVALLSRILHIKVRNGFWTLHLLSLAALIMEAWLFCKNYQRESCSLFLLPAALVYMQYLWLMVMAAFSEVLFMPLALGSLLLLETYLKKGKIVFLLASMSLCSYGILTRYAGIYLILCALVILLSCPGKPLSRRIMDCSLYAVGSIIPFLLWQWRNIILTGAMRGSRVTETAVLRRFHELFRLTGELLFPVPHEIAVRIPPVLLDAGRSLPAIGLFILLGLLVWKRRPEHHINSLAISSLAYLAFVCVTTMLTGEPYPFDFRIMLPMFLPLALMVVNASQKTDTLPMSTSCKRLLTGCLWCSFLWNTLYCIMFLWRQYDCAR